jgi:hypothetical protein
MAEIADDTRREATPEGCGASADDSTPHGGNGTPPHPANGHGAVADIEVLPHPGMNNLWERQ